MLLTMPIHPVEVIEQNNLGVEFHITMDDRNPEKAKYAGLVKGLHLPYEGLNLAALDDAERNRSIQVMKDAIDAGAIYGVDKMVLHPCGVFEFKGEATGNYDRLFSALGELADYMAARRLVMCIENQMLRPRELRLVYGCSPEEWFGIQRDLGRQNVMLTFDSSHAAAYAAHFNTYEERLAAMREFLAKPELIGRIHWSDAIISDQSSRYKDSHLVPGKGDLPLDFHRALLRHPAVNLLEQHCTTDELLEGLDFIGKL